MFWRADVKVDEENQVKVWKVSLKCSGQTKEKYVMETKGWVFFWLDKIYTCLNDAFKVLQILEIFINVEYKKPTKLKG